MDDAACVIGSAATDLLLLLLLLLPTAKCNPGGSPTVTYASGSPSIPAPTVSCLYDTASLPYFGKWGTTVTGRCIAVCRNGPPAATGEHTSLLHC
jgi:hypothetical protein